MDLVTWGRNPWGQDVLLHASLNLLYLAVAAGAVFIVAHALYVWLWAPAAGRNATALPTRSLLSVPERVERHSLGARLFHAIVAIAMLTLIGTAFLPMLGVQFAWVALHWIAGLVITAAVAYHGIHTSTRLTFASIWLNREDLHDARIRLARAFGAVRPPARLPGKYPIGNKLFHAVTLLAATTAILTGLLMLKRVRTPFFTRDPYILGDQIWGVFYVVHGVAGVALVTLVMTHLYFAVRPDKRFITRSMILGWVTRASYLDHHDPLRWIAGGASSRAHEKVRV